MQGCLPVFWITAKKIKYVRQKCDFSSCFYHMNVFVCFSVKHARAKLIIPWKLDNTSFKFPIFGVRISLLPIFIPMVVNVSFFSILVNFTNNQHWVNSRPLNVTPPPPRKKEKTSSFINSDSEQRSRSKQKTKTTCRGKVYSTEVQ